MTQDHHRELEDQLSHDPAQEQAENECADFQAMLPVRIGAGEDLQDDPHMLTCERCRALIGELEYIAEAARLLMSIEAEPPDDLWLHIEQAIERGDA